MITLNAADEPDPARGFVADYTLTPRAGGCEYVWPIPGAAPHSPLLDQPAVPWLSEWREPTISLTRAVLTNSAGGTSTAPIMFRFPPKET